MCKCLDMYKLSLCLHCNIYSRLKNSDTLQSRMSYSENAMLAVQDVLDAHLHFGTCNWHFGVSMGFSGSPTIPESYELLSCFCAFYLYLDLYRCVR